MTLVSEVAAPRTTTGPSLGAAVSWSQQELADELISKFLPCWHECPKSRWTSHGKSAELRTEQQISWVWVVFHMSSMTSTLDNIKLTLSYVLGWLECPSENMLHFWWECLHSGSPGRMGSDGRDKREVGWELGRIWWCFFGVFWNE